MYLAPGAVDGGLARITYDLTSGSTESDDLGIPPAGAPCSVQDVVGTSTWVACDDPEGFGRLFYDVTGAGEWRSISEPAGPAPLIQQMLQCGAPDLPWSATGRALSAGTRGAGLARRVHAPGAGGCAVPAPDADLRGLTADA